MGIDIQNPTSCPVVCINLDKRPERWTAFQAQSFCARIPVKHLSAVDGSALDVKTHPSLSEETRRRILTGSRRAHGDINTLGAIGCTLSHRSAWEYLVKSKAPWCLVLEDDSKVSQNLRERILSAGPPPGSRKNPDTPLVWLLGPRLLEPPVPYQGAWTSPTSFWGTSAYLVNQAAAEVLLAKTLPVEAHLDHTMLTQQTLGTLRLLFHPSVRTSTAGLGTDIQAGGCDLCDLPDHGTFLTLKTAVGLALLGGIGIGLLIYCARGDV